MVRTRRIAHFNIAMLFVIVMNLTRLLRKGTFLRTKTSIVLFNLTHTCARRLHCTCFFYYSLCSV